MHARIQDIVWTLDTIFPGGDLILIESGFLTVFFHASAKRARVANTEGKGQCLLLPF